MNLRDAFAVLEIPEGSSLEETKKAYRRLCIVWHPDRFSDPEMKSHAEAKLKRINEAFSAIQEASHFEREGSSEPFDESDEAGDTDFIHQDVNCRYCGDDPRLRKLSRFEFRGRPCALQFTEDRLVLVTHSDGELDEVETYPILQLIRVRATRRDWILPGKKDFYFLDPNRPFVKPDRLQIIAWDPEEILSQPLTVEVSFRSDYHCELFAKKLCDAWRLIEPRPKPKPAPKPKNPENPAPVPTASAAIETVPYHTLGMMLIVVSLTVLFGLFVMATSRQPNASGEVLVRSPGDELANPTTERERFCNLCVLDYLDGLRSAYAWTSSSL